MNQNTFPRPAYGDLAYILAPKVEHQFKWLHLVKGGSAIVGFPVDPQHFVIYYEGNLYEAENLNSFKERAIVAYGRLTKRAPTIAFCRVDCSEFEVVGVVSSSAYNVMPTTAFTEWLSLDALVTA